MAKEITIDTDSLGKDIDVLQTHLAAIEKDMDKMYEAVRVLDTMWDGPANAAFNQQFAKDKQDMATLCQTVQKIIKCLEYAKKQYNSCEADVGNIVSAIKV